MDNAALGRFIDRGDERANARLIFLSVASFHTFVHLAQPGQDAAISECAHGRLAGAFGGGFCVGHEVDLGVEGTNALCVFC